MVGEARAKEFREVYALAPGAHPVGLTGQDPLGLVPLNPITNPYDLLPAPSGGLLVSDAGANAVWRVTLAGEIHPFARLDPQIYATADGSAQVEAVPTGIALGPDGAAYIATLTGFPFPTGGARILRLQDDNGDGDALDLGETTVYVDGFTAATDVAFEADGAMLVTEYSGDMRSLAEVGSRSPTCSQAGWSGGATVSCRWWPMASFPPRPWRWLGAASTSARSSPAGCTSSNRSMLWAAGLRR